LKPIEGNLYNKLPETSEDEQFISLLSTPGVRVERIVSTGQQTPPGEWLKQKESEWVILLKGSAAIRFDGEPEARQLSPGDYLFIPTACRHRVEWTDANQKSIWLAIHILQ